MGAKARLPRIPKEMKFGVTLAAVFLSAFGAFAWLSSDFVTQQAEQIHRRIALQSAQSLSERLSDALNRLYRDAGDLTVEAINRYGDPQKRQNMLSESLRGHHEVLAVSYYQRYQDGDSRWMPLLRAVKPADDPLTISSEDWNQLDETVPLHPKDVEKTEQAEFKTGYLKDGTPVIRILTPYGPRRSNGYTKLLQIEILPKFFETILNADGFAFTFVVDGNHHLALQSKSNHFRFDSDLAHLPVLQAARATPALNDYFDYHELPGQPLQLGAFTKSQTTGFLVVSQVSQNDVIPITARFKIFAISLPVVLALICLFMTIQCGIAFRIWGWFPEPKSLVTARPGEEPRLKVHSENTNRVA